MRLVVVTDVHGKLEKVRKLTKTLAGLEVDALLIAGDLTHFGGAEQAKDILHPLRNLGFPLLTVHGNCDGRDVPELLDGLGIGVHGKRVDINGLGVIGIGGSNQTPFHTVWELTEDEIRGVLERNYRPGDVILSHVPPYGTIADRVHLGRHVGSKALRRFIEEHKPPLVVCGHIHEGKGEDRIGETVVVNPGPLFRGYYAVIEFDEKEKKVRNVELLRL
ncbi:metallophosphoesterase [Thermococcus sp.]|uniref:metallophosphoesterase family protein n=1 Tax=Thermococcus sp. TaxID=35749 RepID=UPI00262FDFB2|nr:metallophosphoesterase [Thermococcus sp.]